MQNFLKMMKIIQMILSKSLYSLEDFHSQRRAKKVKKKALSLKNLAILSNLMNFLNHTKVLSLHHQKDARL